MEYRFVRVPPKHERMPELRERLLDAIEPVEPFGETMTNGVGNARFDPDTGEAVWVAEEYLDADPDARAAFDRLRTWLREDRDIAFVCYENTDDTRCHRTLLREHLDQSRTAFSYRREPKGDV